MALPTWMEQAWAEIGQREGQAGTDNPRIVAFYRDAGHAEAKHDEIAWCAAFVGACLERAGHHGSRSLMARSYLDWGAPVKSGRLGAVAVFSRGSDPAAGHVAFYLDEDATNVHVLGGNQGDAVSVATIPRDRLLGLRWPVENGASTELRPTAVVASPVISSVNSVFDIALTHVLAMEGGWTEDPYDPGGPTNFGITLATLAAYRNIHVDQTTFPTMRESLRGIAKSEVEAIYIARYWTPSRAAQLAPPLAIMHFDAAVNHGVGGAARILQEAAGVVADGDIGPETLAACNRTGPGLLLQRYADIRRARYRALPTFWRFGRGWLARVDATLRIATSTTSTSNGVNPMTEQAAQPTPHVIPAAAAPASGATKWWGESITVWGALITGVATVIPALGPIIGLDISGEMIRQLGTQGVHAVQAIGGLMGTVMTIYGRARASTGIGLRSVTMRI